MSSSRSDDVTQFVIPSVPFFSFSVFEVCSAFRMSTRCLKGVSRKFQGCFKEVSRMFHGSLKGVSRKFEGCFKEVSRVFHGSFKGVQGSFKGVSRKS